MLIEAMKQALEALTTLDSGSSYKTHNAATALYRAIEQAEKQEPVAWWNPTKDTASTDPVHRHNADCVPLYPAPRQREWIGLTDEDYKALEVEVLANNMSYREVLKWADKTLKEKNT
jgi:hypothetical protein